MAQVASRWCLHPPPPKGTRTCVACKRVRVDSSAIRIFAQWIPRFNEGLILPRNLLFMEEMQGESSRICTILKVRPVLRNVLDILEVPTPSKKHCRAHLWEVKSTSGSSSYDHANVVKKDCEE